MSNAYVVDANMVVKLSVDLVRQLAEEGLPVLYLGDLPSEQEGM